MKDTDEGVGGCRGEEEEKAGVMPPDLNELARPVAVPSPQNCDGAAASMVLHSPRSIETAVSKAGEKSNGEARVSVTPEATPTVNRYLLKPDLRACFAAVGATDKAYSFKEILSFLKYYLYSRRHLFDANDILYVNCKDDDLGDALQVDRFHYSEVRSLIAANILPEPKDSLENSHGVIQGSSVCSISGASSNLLFGQSSSYERASSDASMNGCVNPSLYCNGKTTSEVSDGLDFSKQSLQPELERQRISHCSSVPGSSRQTTEDSNYQRASSLSSHPLKVQVTVPEVPDSVSDSESVYSYQGYETAYCRNTEFEESDASEEIEFEEYELASDDEEMQGMEHSDDDSDSMIEDVEVALLAVQALYDDESEEDFWADDSDCEDQSTDDDPELAQEKWKCVTCGIQNKAFVRYCGKCWQVRKNWLPERPKKKRRKPRPKKKLRRRSDSLKSDASATEVKESEFLGGESSTLTRTFSTATTDREEGANDLTRTLSTATTISLETFSPRSYSFEQINSQDSGISLSQDTLTESSQDIASQEARPSCSREGGESSRAFSRSVREETYSSDLSQSESSPEQTIFESSSKKRKSPPGKDESKSKRSKTYSIDILEETTLTGSESYKNILRLLKNANKSELEEVEKFWKLLKNASKNEVDEVEKFWKLLKNTNKSEYEVEKFLCRDTNDAFDLCSICCLRPKNATMVHGRLSHQATCYQCARRLLNTGARCPVCRRKIHMHQLNQAGQAAVLGHLC